MLKLHITAAMLLSSSVAFAQIGPANITAGNAPSPGHYGIVADGTIQNVFAGKNQASPASGSLGFAFTSGTGNERFAAYLTVAQAIDTLRGHVDKTFGRAVLAPEGTGSSGFSSFAAEYQRYFNYGKVNQRFGPRAYISYTQTTWEDDSSQPFVANDLGIITGGVRAFWVPINFPAPPNTFSFTVELGGTFRALTGDGADDAVLMQRTLGTSKKFFWGPDFRATIQVRQLSGFFGLSVLGKPDGTKVTGLTGSQSVFGFSLDAPIFTN